MAEPAGIAAIYRQKPRLRDAPEPVNHHRSMTPRLGGSCRLYTYRQYRAWDRVRQAGFSLFSLAAAGCQLIGHARNTGCRLWVAACGRWRIYGPIAAGKP